MTKSTASEKPVTKADLFNFVGPLVSEIRQATKADMIAYVGPVIAELRQATKADMINYVGPIFAELRREFKSDLKGEIKKLRDELTDKINWQGTLLEQMDKKLNTALDISSTTLEHEEVAKNHEERISILEHDVKVIKLSRKKT